MKIKPPAMTRVIFLVPALLLLLSASFSGCITDSLFPAPATTVPAPQPMAVPETIAITSATPTPAPATEPVRPLPPEQRVDLALTKDRPTSEIHLLYQGGPGDLLVTRIVMRVYTSETDYQEYIMSNGKKPLPGDEIIAPGTRSGDRCEVFVISSGTRYKVMDEPVFGGMYY
jgi:hypothetical protein